MEIKLEELCDIIAGTKAVANERIKGDRVADQFIPDGETCIVVLQRGWVAVGYWQFCLSDDTVTLRQAKIIRRWGTTHGLGEIAAAGPTEETVLDPAGILRFHEFSVVCRFVCNAKAWESVLCK